MTAERLIGACHCGAVTVSLPAPPVAMNRCNCSLCNKLGVLWGYYDAADVLLSDATLAHYQRADVAIPSLTIDRCAACGCTVRWRATVPKAVPRIGVNMNLFAPEALDGIEIRDTDGRRRVK